MTDTCKTHPRSLFSGVQVLFSLLSLSLLPLSAAEQEFSALAKEQFDFAAKQCAGMLSSLQGETVKLPRTVANGKLVTIKDQDWTSGFFPGTLWLSYEQTKDPALKAAAEDFTARVKQIQYFKGHHDVGFMLDCSYGEAYRITGNPEYKTVLVNGARSLATRFNPKVGLIKSWDIKRWSYPVIVDNMMNLNLLWFAADLTGDDSLRKIALSHADKTLANHFRPDASSYHLLDYDTQTGAVIKRQTVQGYADPSAWARGQAWGLNGFTTMARLSKNPAYLEQARKIAQFILTHPRLPADGIPYWDFDVPEIPNVPRDASAAAVMAMAFIELSDLVPAAEGARYLAMAEKQLRSLSSPAYRAKLGENGNFILMHSVGHLTAQSEVDVPLNYADYYYLKAMSLMLAKTRK